MDLPVKRVEQISCGACGASIDPAALPPLSVAACPKCGAEVIVPAKFDHYLLLKVIGSGGTGVVLRALDDTLYRQVAIKILRGQGDADQTTLAITREARALASVNAPGIVAIHELGQWRGRHYIVMELLDGGTAKRYLDPDSRLDEAGVLTFALAIARGLAAAHKVGLVHMDVKPSNILLNKAGEPKLIDFGAAQYAQRQKGGSVVGTPYYIAPEVLRGHTPDFKADIFSFGATLFHLLTGEPPFDSPSVHAMIMHRLSHPVRRVREVNPMISRVTDELIGKMTQARRDARHAGYEGLIAEIEAALSAGKGGGGPPRRGRSGRR